MFSTVEVCERIQYTKSLVKLLVQQLPGLPELFLRPCNLLFTWSVRR